MLVKKKMSASFLKQSADLKTRSSSNNSVRIGVMPLLKIDRSLTLKKNLLKDQISRSKKATFELRKYIKYQSILHARNLYIKTFGQIYSSSAVKIQKVFRGYMARKRAQVMDSDLQKRVALNKISNLKTSVINIFLNSKCVKSAALIILKYFRVYKKRKIFKAWKLFHRIYKKKIFKMKEIQQVLKVFYCKTLLLNAKSDARRSKLLKKISKKLAIIKAKLIWKRTRMNFKKIMRNIRKFKQNLSLDDEQKPPLHQDHDATLKISRHLDSEAQSFLDSKRNKKESLKIIIKKPTITLPMISMTPTYSKSITPQTRGRLMSENKLKAESLSKDNGGILKRLPKFK